jgi:PHP family Zn ribbon phosphoesterase
MEKENLEKKFEDYQDIHEIKEAIQEVLRKMDIDYNRTPGTTRQYFNIKDGSGDYIGVLVNNFRIPPEKSVWYNKWNKEKEIFEGYQTENIKELYFYLDKREPMFLGENLLKEVECKKCGWQWEIEPSDDEPYLCHSCGYHNEEMTYRMDKLKEWKNKMKKRYIKEYKEFLLDGKNIHR